MLDLILVRLLVELDQQVPLFHTIVVVHQDAAHLAGDPGGHEGHVAVDVSVIGGDRIQHRFTVGARKYPATTKAAMIACMNNHFRKRCDGPATGPAAG